MLYRLGQITNVVGVIVAVLLVGFMVLHATANGFNPVMLLLFGGGALVCYLTGRGIRYVFSGY